MHSTTTDSIIIIIIVLVISLVAVVAGEFEKVMDMDGITENDNSVNLFLSSVYKPSSAFVLAKPVHLSLLKTIGIFYRTIAALMGKVYSERAFLVS